jgi:hypothetical protein
LLSTARGRGRPLTPAEGGDFAADEVPKAAAGRARDLDDLEHLPTPAP